MIRQHNTTAPELRAPAASLFDNDSDLNQDDYFDQLQEEAECELLRMGVGSRRSILTDDAGY